MKELMVIRGICVRRTQSDEVIDGCKQLEASVFGGRSPMK